MERGGARYSGTEVEHSNDPKKPIVENRTLTSATRIAVRTNGTLSYLLGDHPSTSLRTSLGSSSVTANASGVKTASALYKAFGETRFSSGNLGTDYKFTGQREQAELGLYFYGARWYDGSLGRFTSADTMVPSTQGVQAWDRYAYVNNNPVKYTDPTGNMIDKGDGGGATCGGYGQPPCEDNGNDNGGDGSDDETNCDGSGLIDQYCVDLSAEDAQDLENFLDGPGNIGTVTGFAGLVIDLGSLVAWANLSAFQKAIIIALIGGADMPIALVGMILSGTLLAAGVETNALSENLSDSGITQTGGTLTVSTNLLYDIYELQTPSGKTYTSISVVQFPAGVKVTSTMIYGWLSFRNGSPYSWDW